ncbi:MAG: Uma2 family endonuclease [Bacteroidetes bacterium]|nr:Uma2 family endonuclease [Bacteroidota bacterium]
MITSISQLDPNGSYTYADYLLWKFEERIELLRGKIHKMAAPSRRHQGISFTIAREIAIALKHSPCKAYTAPFDVRLTRTKNNKQVKTVVQPDLCVICDITKLDDRGCSGAPELIIEIISPGNSKTEMKDKFELYQEAGVLEYWIVSPIEKTVQVFKLNDEGIYIGLAPKVEDDLLTTTIIPNLEIDLMEVFSE